MANAKVKIVQKTPILKIAVAMSRNDAFDEGVGKSRERNVVKPRSLEERMPMLFDPQYDAPEEHQNYSASHHISGEINTHSEPTYGSHYRARCGSSVLHGMHGIRTEGGMQGFCNGNRGEPIVEQPVNPVQRLLGPEVVRRQGRSPSTDARQNTKVWGLFHDPGSYAHPELSDAEPFTSISHARNVFHHRVNGGDSYYPGVSHQAELHLYLGGHPDEMQDPYPDRIIKKGPRGGTNVERV